MPLWGGRRGRKKLAHFHGELLGLGVAFFADVAVEELAGVLFVGGLLCEGSYLFIFGVCMCMYL
jgi:hypothetical protein